MRSFVHVIRAFVAPVLLSLLAPGIAFGQAPTPQEVDGPPPSWSQENERRREDRKEVELILELNKTNPEAAAAAMQVKSEQNERIERSQGGAGPGNNLDPLP